MGCPARVVERYDVGVPLPLREFGIDVIAALDVGDQSVGESRGWSSDESMAGGHQAPTVSVSFAFDPRRPSSRMPW